MKKKFEFKEDSRLYLVCKDWEVVNVSPTAAKAAKWAKDLNAEVILQIYLENMYTKKDSEWLIN